ncbi:hypothetical protein ACWKTZ_24305 [Bacillus cereus]
MIFTNYILPVVGVGLSIAAYKVVKNKKKNKENSAINTEIIFPTYEIPKHLGVQKNLDLEELVERLEESMNPEFMQSVKERVLRGQLIDESQYDWYLLELKRFFIMSSVLKNVPMYNEKVDEIWHEMLMFTKSYERFGQEFLGDMIHHEPNVGQSIRNPESERAWFEYIYSELFEVGEYTRLIYGNFFQYPIDKEILKKIDTLSEDELLHTYFNANTYEATNVSVKLITKLKKRIRNITYETKNSVNSNVKYGSDRFNTNYQKKESDQNSDFYTNSFLYYSMLTYDNDSYKEATKHHHEVENNKDTATNKDSSCSGWSSCQSTTPAKSSCKSCSGSHHSCSKSSCSSCSSSSCSSSSCSSCSS